MYGPAHQPIPLQPAQGHGQHALADSGDAAAELGEPLGGRTDLMDDRERPLVPDPVEDLPRLAGGLVVHRFPRCH
jgi:hypothetical protein